MLPLPLLPLLRLMPCAIVRALSGRDTADVVGAGRAAALGVARVTSLLDGDLSPDTEEDEPPPAPPQPAPPPPGPPALPPPAPPPLAPPAPAPPPPALPDWDSLVPEHVVGGRRVAVVAALQRHANPQLLEKPLATYNAKTVILHRDAKGFVRCPHCLMGGFAHKGAVSNHIKQCTGCEEVCVASSPPRPYLVLVPWV